MSRFPVTTAARAAAHEALFPRLAALAAQADSIARRRPEAPVPASTAILAESLLYEAGPFLGRGARNRLVPAPPDFGGLSAMLGQALAGLAAFEARHAPWDATRNCFAWQLPRRARLPVQRLRPVGIVADRDPAAEKRANFIRDDLLRRFKAKEETAREDGYAAGLAAGRASRAGRAGRNDGALTER